MNAQHIEGDFARRIDPESNQAGSSCDDRKPASMSMQPEQHPQSHLFTLRIWEEALGEGKAEWRGRVHDVANGETLFFRDWPALISTLQRLIAQTAAAGVENPGPPSPPDENDE